jgi:ADP-glucose pyrophosphorylase
VPVGIRTLGSCYFGPGITASSASVKDSAIGRGCHLEGTVESCLLLDLVIVEKGAALRGCVAGEGCRIGAGASLRDCVLGDGATVSPRTILVGTSVEAGSSI